MELADNGDFNRSADMPCVWARCDLGHFTVDVCVAGRITDKFPAEVVDNYVEITLSHAEDEEAVFCCSYTPNGLQCVHIDTSFLIAYGGIAIAPRSDEGMRTFVDILMQDLSENRCFAQIREKQFLTSVTEFLTGTK